LTEVLRLEGVAAAATARALVYRNELTTEARAELEREGSAPTWRIPDMATISLGVSKEAVYVSNEVALLEWVTDRYPDQVVTVEQVRLVFRNRLLDEAIINGNNAVDKTTGEIIRGVAVRAGGVAGSLSIRPTHEAQIVFEAIGERTLDELLAPNSDYAEDHR
jgi:hypothetical protein